MSDYIKREDIRKAFDTAIECKECSRNIDRCFGQAIDMSVLCETIDNLPSADVVEQKSSVWVYQLRDSENEEYKCFRCGDTQGYKSNFCPNCGADMRADRKE